MSRHYDDLETMAPQEREARLLEWLSRLGLDAADASPFWKERLTPVLSEGSLTREGLARLPVLRKSDLPGLQAASPPFAGVATAPAAAFPRLFVSPGPICEPQATQDDAWNTARALFAAGFGPGQIVLNTFSYHLTPGGFVMDSGARALGCAVIPAGPGNTEQVVQAIGRYRPQAYTGTADFLNILVEAADAAGIDNPFERAAASGAALPPSLRAKLSARGIAVFELYATAELGVIAYESEAHEGLVVNEDVIVELLAPGTGDPVGEGEVGEVVVTRLDAAYPLIRFATGDLSRFIGGTSACGRTGRRLAGWLGRADETAKVKGMFVHPAQVRQILAAHQGAVTRARLVVTREDERDVLTLEAEASPASDLETRLAESVREVTRLGAAVRILEPGRFGDDPRLIVDRRSYD